jgi:hypothetical protein
MLVRLCQETNYGFIHDLQIHERQPVFEPPPPVILDLKLDGTGESRPETVLADFQLPAEVFRLMEILDGFFSGTIESIEVRAGIPRRVVFRAKVQAFAPGNSMLDGSNHR